MIILNIDFSFVGHLDRNKDLSFKLQGQKFFQIILPLHQKGWPPLVYAIVHPQDE